MAKHIFDWTPTTEQEEFLRSNSADTARRWDDRYIDEDDNSNQCVIGKYRNTGAVFHKWPHSDCVGGISYYSSDKQHCGGLFSPSRRRLPPSELPAYSLYLDWVLSAGMSSSVFLTTDDAPPVVSSDFDDDIPKFLFHMHAPGNVVGAAIIVLRMWQDSFRLGRWISFMKAGVHPWPALYLAHNTIMHGDAIYQHSHWCDHSTLSWKTSFNDYKAGIIHKPSSMADGDECKLSYNGSYLIWNNPDIKPHTGLMQLMASGGIEPTTKFTKTLNDLPK